jgi:cell division protein FtsL
MTHYQATAIRSNYGWRQNRTLNQKLQEVQKFGNVSRSVLAIVIVLVLGLVYVSQATKAGSLAGPIREMETKVASLKEENQGLTVEVAKMQSLGELKKSEVAGTLTAPSDVQFVD